MVIFIPTNIAQLISRQRLFQGNDDLLKALYHKIPMHIYLNIFIVHQLHNNLIMMKQIIPTSYLLNYSHRISILQKFDYVVSTSYTNINLKDILRSTRLEENQ